MTTLYDFLAPTYDPAFQSIYRPFRERALERLPRLTGATVLDLACGTGQNFPLLAGRVGGQGKIIGLDLSPGMLRRARRRAAGLERANVTLIEMDATLLSLELLQAKAGITSVDGVVCTYGFTSMRDWQSAFCASWDVLAPGGFYLIHDIDGQRRNLHTWAVEMATHCDFSRKVWQLLEKACPDFRMDYIEPSAHLFGGRLFVAHGTKSSIPPTSPCPS